MAISKDSIRKKVTIKRSSIREIKKIVGEKGFVSTWITDLVEEKLDAILPDRKK